MPLNFEGETLLIDGREYVGTVVVETEVSDASFDFEQGDIRGTHHEIDIDHEPILFLANGLDGDAADYVNDRARPALIDWGIANERRMDDAFDLACKRGDLL